MAPDTLSNVPLPKEIVAKKNVRFGDLFYSHHTVVWSEIKREEKGRASIALWNHSNRFALLPSPYSASTRVHEYGGGSFFWMPKMLFFVHQQDNQLYVFPSSSRLPYQLTKKEHCRYAEPLFDPKRKWVYAIEEDHREGGEPKNRIVAIDPFGKREMEVVAEGADFYSSLSLSDKDDRLAFLYWNHPQMPWDGTFLAVAHLDAKRKTIPIKSILGSTRESIFQPSFSPEGDLYFVSDREGFWNLWREEKGDLLPCYPMQAEFGEPQWIFGLSRYGFLKNRKVACFFTKKGIDTLAICDPYRQTLQPIDLPFTHYSHLKTDGMCAAFFAGSMEIPWSLAHYDFSTNHLQTLAQSYSLPFDREKLSHPKYYTFPTRDGEEASGFYYPPKTDSFSRQKTKTLPPLLVKSHGGPSSRASPSLKLEIQFWTSRGFAFFDVNYRGSTGYGRAYRERLQGNWGIIDVEDCISGALYLVSLRQASPDQLLIKGSSAGGYTALCALTFHHVFQGGAIYYGISDLESLALSGTHKFESHYFDTLIGPYRENKEIYRQRSPLQHSQKLQTPTIFFQGEADPIVPKNQSEEMYLSLKKRRISTSYLLFPGEGHGFKHPTTIAKTLETELLFYQLILSKKQGLEL